MMRLVPLFLMLAVTVAAVPAGAAEPMEERATAILQALDKVTARVRELEVAVGGSVRFGALSITVRTCREAPPIEAPESAAFVEVTEAKPGELPAPLFSGWMFASSPALSALEHPVYDIWVVDCQ